MNLVTAVAFDVDQLNLKKERGGQNQRNNYHRLEKVVK